MYLPKFQKSMFILHCDVLLLLSGWPFFQNLDSQLEKNETFVDVDVYRLIS